MGHKNSTNIFYQYRAASLSQIFNLSCPSLTRMSQLIKK